MKKQLYGLLMLMVLVISCKVDYSELYYKGDAFVLFPKTEDNLFEAAGGNPGVRKVQLNRSSSDISAALTVNFSISSKYVSGPNTGSDANSTFTAMGDGGGATSVVIPAGKSSAEITITAVNNAILDGYKELVLNLTSGGDLKIGYPGPAGTGKSMKLVIFDDEDPSFNILKFLGTYECTDPAISGSTHLTNYKPSSLSPTSIVSTNFCDGVLGVPAQAVIFTLEPSNNSIVIPLQEFPTSNDAAGNPRNWMVSGTGTFNPQTGQMNTTVLLRRKTITSSGISIATVIPAGTQTYVRK